MIHQLDFNGKDKVDKAIMRLQAYEPPEGYYLCFSGGTPHLEHLQGFDKHDTYAICPNCGCRTSKQQTPYWAWKAWDLKQLEVTDTNITIWELM